GKEEGRKDDHYIDTSDKVEPEFDEDQYTDTSIKVESKPDVKDEDNEIEAILERISNTKTKLLTPKSSKLGNRKNHLSSVPPRSSDEGERNEGEAQKEKVTGKNDRKE